MYIAVLEDDVALAEIMQIFLSGGGHQVKLFHTGHGFMQGVSQERFDLLLFDWMLPDIHGYEVLKWVRQNLDYQVPVIFATSRNDEEDIVNALAAGADDYMIKPVGENELLARIQAVVRRYKKDEVQDKTTTFIPYEIDNSNRRITNDGNIVNLTRKEFELACYLFCNSDRLVTRDELLDRVWGTTADVSTRTVDTHISRLRKKLAISEMQGWRLEVVYQYGYRLEKVHLAS